MASITDKWVRVFDIPETSKHIKGFTLYKIVSIVYPKTCPDAVTKVTVWKRYNDFKRLHRELKLRHKSLHIEDKYPGLSLSSFSYFKRFDPEIINQRRNSVLSFLEFVALHPPLFKSTEFVKFFETSHTPQESLNSNINIIRAQLNLPNDPEIVCSYNSDEEQALAYSDTDSMSTLSSVSVTTSHSATQLDDTFCERKSDSCLSDVSKSISSCSKVSSPETVCHSAIYPPTGVAYLTTAALHVTRATDLELEQRHQEAFAAYKQAIATLLDGVKDDIDTSRRQMIRRKTEKYLLRAEKIYNLYLSPEINQIKSICGGGGGDVPVYSARRPLAELFQYRVVGIRGGGGGDGGGGGGGLVVLQRRLNTLHFLKVMAKGAAHHAHALLPTHVPFMVPLQHYYDHPNNIFLVMPYISGGRLFDNIKQKSTSTTNTSIQYSSVSFEKETLGRIDNEFDENSSDSEYSYTDLITEYTTKKVAQFDTITTGHNKAQNGTKDTTCSLISKEHHNDIKNTSPIEESTSVGKTLTEPEGARSIYNIPEAFEAETFQELESDGSTSLLADREDVVRWAAQLLLALERLHQLGIIITDLQPRNLLLDETRDLLLTYTCALSGGGGGGDGSGGGYIAPELQGPAPPTPATDTWSYGALLYRLLTGLTLECVHPEGIWNYTILKIPKYVCPEGKSLLRQLLRYEPRERLSEEDIRAHPFFVGVEWARLQEPHH